MEILILGCTCPIDARFNQGYICKERRRVGGRKSGSKKRKKNVPGN